MSAYAIQIQVEGNAITGMKQIGAQIDQLNAKTKEIHGNFDGLKGKIGGLASELKSLAIGALGIGSAFAGFEFIKSSKEMFDKFEEGVTKVETVLTSTGHAANLSFEEISEGAKKLSGQTLFSRSQLLDASSMLLTFTQIRGEIFNKSIPAVTDFATRFKMELPEAANMLGKALNDPLKGMTRLQRQGVVFSDQQKETIKQFMATGQVAKAQEVILKELGTEFGGLAHAMTQTDEGKLKMAAKTLDNFKISVGQLVSSFLVGLIPAFNYVVKVAKEFKDWITGSSDSAYIFKEAVIILGGALATYLVIVNAIKLATQVWTAVQWALNVAMTANPIGLIVVAVVALIAGIAALWDKCEGFRKVVGGIFAEIAKVIMGVVHIFTNFAHMVGDVFTGHFKEAGKAGKQMIADFKNDFTKGWGEAWDKGAEKAKNSKFKFGGLIGLGGKKEGKVDANGNPIIPKMGEGSLAQSAINTSALGGASGGLGEAKVIKIDFHKALMEVNVPGGNGTDIIGKGQLTVEAMLRIINNLSMAQGATM
jgi:hypothetical protein